MRNVGLPFNCHTRPLYGILQRHPVKSRNNNNDVFTVQFQNMVRALHSSIYFRAAIFKHITFTIIALSLRYQEICDLKKRE